MMCTIEIGMNGNHHIEICPQCVEEYRVGVRDLVRHRWHTGIKAEPCVEEDLEPNPYYYNYCPRPCAEHRDRAGTPVLEPAQLQTVPG